MENIPLSSDILTSGSSYSSQAAGGVSVDLLNFLSGLEEGANVPVTVKALISATTSNYLFQIVGENIEFAAQSAEPLSVGFEALLKLLSVGEDGKVEFKLIQQTEVPAPGTEAAPELASGIKVISPESTKLTPTGEQAAFLRSLGLPPSLENFEIVKALIRYNLPVTKNEVESIVRVLSSVLEISEGDQTSQEVSASSRGPGSMATSDVAPIAIDSSAKTALDAQTPIDTQSISISADNSIASASYAYAAGRPDSIVTHSASTEELVGLLKKMIEGAVIFEKESIIPSPRLVAQFTELSTTDEGIGDRAQQLISKFAAFFSEGDAPVQTAAKGAENQIQLPPELLALAKEFDASTLTKSEKFEAMDLRRTVANPFDSAIFRNLGAIIEAATKRLFETDHTLRLLRAMAQEFEDASRPRLEEKEQSPPDRRSLSANEAMRQLRIALAGKERTEDQVRELARNVVRNLSIARLRIVKEQLVELERDVIARHPKFAELRDAIKEARDISARAQVFRMFSMHHSVEGEQRVIYYEIPLQNKNFARRGTLKVAYRQGGGKKRDPSKPVTIAIGLDTANVGRVEAKLTALQSNLDLVFTLDGDVTRGLFEESIGTLKQSLNSIGYQTNVFLKSRSSEPEVREESTIATFAKDDGNVMRLDLRI
ncbi:MAG: hypothetical protein NUW37_13390 [Planctomycetes bacterium]|nr:hypothetical protein [Planctomycetota bacterium]